MQELELGLDLDGGGVQRLLRGRSEGHEHERRQQMVQSEVRICVKLLTEPCHVVEPTLNVGRHSSRRTIDLAFDSLSQLQVGHERTVQREKLKDFVPTKGGTVRLRGLNIDEDMTNVRSIRKYELQTLVDEMLQRVRRKPIVGRKEGE